MLCINEGPGPMVVGAVRRRDRVSYTNEIKRDKRPRGLKSPLGPTKEQNKWY